MKAQTNLGKHGISFDDAMQIFHDAHAQSGQDQTDERGELRWRTAGLVADVVLLLVVHLFDWRARTK